MEFSRGMDHRNTGVSFDSVFLQYCMEVVGGM